MQAAKILHNCPINQHKAKSYNKVSELKENRKIMTKAGTKVENIILLAGNLIKKNSYI